MLRTIRNAKGFTLVELAIVLVIIGIILGAVLKGQEMINNAKIKRAVGQQKEIMAAIYTYYDRYGKYPGDDNTVSTRGGVWATGTTAVDGNGDGLIAGTAANMFTCATGTGGGVEACALWDHLRRANLITGASVDSTNPTNAYGGRIGVANIAVQGLTTNWIGLSNIPADVGQIIDTQNDDGNYQTGSIRGSAVYTGTAAIIIDFKL